MTRKKHFQERFPNLALIISLWMAVLSVASIFLMAQPAEPVKNKPVVLPFDVRVQEAQKVLASIPGMGPIKADGLYGPGSEAAVRKFQKSKGLKVNGNLDFETFVAPMAGAIPHRPNPIFQNVYYLRCGKSPLVFPTLTLTLRSRADHTDPNEVGFLYPRADSDLTKLVAPRTEPSQHIAIDRLPLASCACS